MEVENGARLGSRGESDGVEGRRNLAAGGSNLDVACLNIDIFTVSARQTNPR